MPGPHSTAAERAVVDALRESHVVEALRHARHPLTCTDLCLRIGRDTLTSRQINAGRTIALETYKPALARLVLRGTVTSGLVTRDDAPGRRVIVYALAPPTSNPEDNHAR